jgi:hypothetical protein
VISVPQSIPNTRIASKFTACARVSGSDISVTW